MRKFVGCALFVLSLQASYAHAEDTTGLHATIGLGPYLVALTKFPVPSSVVWGLMIVGGVDYGLSPEFDLRALLLFGGGDSPLDKIHYWFDGGAQISGAYNWTNSFSTELGIRGGVVGLPTRRDVPGATDVPPVWQAYRPKTVGALGPYLAPIRLRGLQLGEYDTMEVALWQSLLVTTNRASVVVVELGISVTYLRL